MAKSRKPVPATIPCSCGGVAKKEGGARIYPHRADLHGLQFYVCENYGNGCDAYVGVHLIGPEAGHPKGTPANAELRKLRMEAHGKFDPIWEKRMKEGDRLARKRMYDWATRVMGLKKQLHIASLSLAECQRFIRLLDELKPS